MAEDPAETLRLRSVTLKPAYDSNDDLLADFYIPVLRASTSYDRSVGYFRSSALAAAARGISRFIRNEGAMRLLVGAEVREEDVDALAGALTLDGAFANRLAEGLAEPTDIEQRRLEVLAWLAREGRLDVRVAIPVDQQGRPVVTTEAHKYFHEKLGVLRDAAGEGVAFQGSVNESATAWTSNFESFSAFSSWDNPQHFSVWANKFTDRWNGHVAGFQVFDLPEAAEAALLRWAPDSEPSPRDPEEPSLVADEALLAAYLLAAPRQVGADALSASTVGVSLFPHQRQVVARLADEYPRSWLLADEVGLGKTISAGMALRTLLLRGEARRVLILAPANVCRQWQDELFEKFGLWVPRLDGGKIHGAHPDDVREVAPGENPYAAEPVLIASSHLARRPDRREQVIAAGPYDLLIVDEAHHARRRSYTEPRYRPTQLLALLDRIRDTGTVQALWLLTATPMQVHPLELFDLLRHVGLDGLLSQENQFTHFYRQLALDDDARTQWAVLDEGLRHTPLLELSSADETLLGRIRAKIGNLDASRIAAFGTGAQATDTIVEPLGPGGRAELRAWIRWKAPVGQLVTRHTRATLRRYKAAGLLDAPLATRDVQPVTPEFTQEEMQLYTELDDVLSRLMDAHGTRKGAGFVLTVYRRRLTSSWAAIERTLQRRLDKEALLVEEDLLDEADDDLTVDELDIHTPGRVDQQEAVPLTEADFGEIQDYVTRLAQVPDSKFDRLDDDLDEARAAGHSTIVFTQFTDTLESLRDRLVGKYQSQLATFTGAGGHMWHPDSGWTPVAKRDLVDAIRSGAVTVLLATDAASEGLNLQACSYLINYDVPWNPMRVEQRIGRVDRLGQERSTVGIRSYFIPGTVEEDVYRTLADHIDLFHDMVGGLQPILGSTEDAFRSIFKAPKAERAAAQKAVLADLASQANDLKAGGLDLGDEDPLPLPDFPASPVTLRDLQVLVGEQLGFLEYPSEHRFTWIPERASRDAEDWSALATYGHPGLQGFLAKGTQAFDQSGGPLVLAGLDSPASPTAAVRADMVPPTVPGSVRELADLSSAVARASAEELAQELVAQEVDRRASHGRLVLTTRRSAQLSRVERDLRRLLAGLVQAGCGYQVALGQDPDPYSVWMDLQADKTSILSYVEAFCRTAGVVPSDFYGAGLTRAPEPISASTWAEHRSEAERHLHDIASQLNALRG